MNDYDKSEKNILIVEDVESIAASHARMLENYGEIDFARNGREALIKVAFNYYDAIVSDVDMPLMNGIEFVRSALIYDDDLKNRIVFVTSSIKEEHLSFFINNDIPYLFKPLDKTEIETEVESIILGYCAWHGGIDN